MYDPTVYRYKILQHNEKINEKTRGRYYKIDTFFKFFPSGMSSPGLFTQRALQQLARIKFPMSLQASLRQTRKLGEQVPGLAKQFGKNPSRPVLPNTAEQSNTEPQ